MIDPQKLTISPEQMDAKHKQLHDLMMHLSSYISESEYKEEELQPYVDEFNRIINEIQTSNS